MVAVKMIVLAVTSVTGISAVLAILLVIAERYLANYGECQIDINKGDKVFTVQGGASLLSSLAREKIFLPSACGGRGTCAYCKCQVVDGAGPLLPTEEPLLDDEEIEQQTRIACQVKVKQDMQILIPEELFNIKEFETEVTLIKDLTYDIKLLRLQLLDPPEITFKAGQYAQLQTKPYNDVKESVSRAYSMASPPFEKTYVDLMVRLVPEGICTTWVHQHLQEGDHVKIIAPVGDFFVREGEGEMLMVAGGSGMAPLASILEDLAKKGSERKITYFFGAVTKKDLFYMDEMRDLESRLPNFTFVPALSDPQPEDEWDGETGLITVPLENYIKDRDNTGVQAYMCGSPGMINACVGVLTKYGITNDNIFYDPFA
ncbi:2Fe-2S iron-sulfur cluster binding domain-containing protein [candidate division KSB3 bacterium]|uniref:2Fe-2S iron-sulfur cluster binding domain-containing protein n=1 Tax=candidate division KSB3 bacterium TaxID=2044937 RepID=A0A9D5JYD8_9BACT|nr:2Fe-2S iron-sulfur cluster binding domain-containing protein [candidate division KSB3 bacterium]MBD3326604.1 2Fe-2S iron-sulfur cluster binding domain-containing protein [candidate division KSB3 bacterium]